MSRRRDRKGLQVARGERYALIPREVLESEAYRAMPPWAIVVLIALAVQYYGSRNGSLALPWSEAYRLGVPRQWHLYGALQLLEAVDLVQCTRRGHLSRGKRLATLYALTWRRIDEPAPDVSYDVGTMAARTPTHGWARWTRPEDWGERMRTIIDRARGAGTRARARDHLRRLLVHAGKNSVSPGGGNGRSHTGGVESRKKRSIAPTPGERSRTHTAPTPGETSEISVWGTASDAWDLVFRLRDPVLLLTAVLWLLIARSPA